jgi:hypothetical protein
VRQFVIFTCMYTNALSLIKSLRRQFCFSIRMKIFCIHNSTLLVIWQSVQVTVSKYGFKMHLSGRHMANLFGCHQQLRIAHKLSEYTRNSTLFKLHSGLAG